MLSSLGVLLIREIQRDCVDDHFYKPNSNIFCSYLRLSTKILITQQHSDESKTWPPWVWGSVYIFIMIYFTDRPIDVNRFITHAMFEILEIEIKNNSFEGFYEFKNNPLLKFNKLTSVSISTRVKNMLINMVMKNRSYMHLASPVARH